MNFCSLFSCHCCAHMKGQSKTLSCWTSQLLILICLVSLLMLCHAVWAVDFMLAWSGFFGWDKSCPRLLWLDFLSVETLLSEVEMPHGSHQLVGQMDSSWLWFFCLNILSKSLWLCVFSLLAFHNPSISFWVSAEKILLWSGPKGWATFAIEDRPFISWSLMVKSNG